jgi:hypothetical protein
MHAWTFNSELPSCQRSPPKAMSCASPGDRSSHWESRMLSAFLAYNASSAFLASLISVFHVPYNKILTHNKQLSHRHMVITHDISCWPPRLSSLCQCNGYVDVDRIILPFCFDATILPTLYNGRCPSQACRLLRIVVWVEDRKSAFFFKDSVTLLHFWRFWH